MRTVRHDVAWRCGAVRALGLWMFVVLAVAGSARAEPCINMLTASSPPAEGYGAAFDTLADARALLIGGTECDGDSARVAVGSGRAEEYVFRTAYYRDGDEWREVPLAGGPLIGGAWYRGRAMGTVPLGPGRRAVLGYVCQRRAGAWKCGCADAGCREQRWQMQVISAPATGLPGNVIPFAQPSPPTLRASDKLVVAHWHQFPISREKAGAESDSYARMLAAGEDGGMGIRLRPLGRPARSEADWLWPMPSSTSAGRRPSASTPFSSTSRPT